MNIPLAERLRPRTLSEVCGQQHLLGEGKVLRRAIENGIVPNMIFYGPSGVGKTTVARIIAENSHLRLHKLNGTSASTGDIKTVISEIGTFSGQGGILLYLDEIQYLNKKQQQSLLECMEDGSVTLIASTTENPYFYIYNALLSRATVFEFKPLTIAEVRQGLDSAIKRIEEMDNVQISAEGEALDLLAAGCGGDMRKALGGLEFACGAASEENGKRILTKELAADVAQRSNMRYDKSDDAHYDSISALQKSIRGSDANAAVHYLACILNGGDMLSACRRLLVIAAEDVGLAYPQAIPIVKACVDSAIQLGMPEARIPLADAAILLATAPKSNSAYCAIGAAMDDIAKNGMGEVPRALQNKHYDGEGAKVKGQNYLYPHNYDNHWVKQQYLPDIYKNTEYYSYGDNKTEQAAKAYWDKIKK
ncbi:MAG: replication-associated recombination protein A [Oscillospiraceae bacterium]